MVLPGRGDRPGPYLSGVDTRTWAGSIVGTVFRALGIGLGVAVVVGVIVMIVQSRSCVPEEECLATVGGIGYGAISGGITIALAVLLLSIRRGVGAIFGTGAAVGLLALLASPWGAIFGWAKPLLLLAAVAVSVAGVLQRCHQQAGDGGRRWSRPSRTSILVATGVILLGLLPLCLD